MRLTIDVEIQDFQTPNFVVPVQRIGKKEDGPGLELSQSIPLRDVPVDLLDRLCENFRREVFRKAERPDPRDFK
jgi:hypothetical protein